MKNRHTGLIVVMTQSKEINLHWFFPPFVDSRGILSGGHGSGTYHNDLAAINRTVDLDYLIQIAKAAETNGIDSVLIPVGNWCEDPFIIAASLVAATERLQFLIALRPSATSPLLTAQTISSIERMSQGRIRVNLVAGGEDKEMRAYGDTTTKEQRYERAAEFLDALHQLLYSTEPIDFSGKYYQLEQAQLPQPLQRHLPIFFSGSSEAAGKVGGKWADTYLTWGEPPAAVAQKTQWINQQVHDAGRDQDIEQGIRFHIITRPTSEEAWAEARRLLEGIDPAEVARVQQRLAQSQSEGQRRMAALHDQGHAYAGADDVHSLEIYPNVWAGIGLLRGGAGTALVGSYDEVAERIAEYYREAQSSHFVLSGYPHLEEVYHIGDGLIPTLKRLGLSVAHS